MNNLRIFLTFVILLSLSVSFVSGAERSSTLTEKFSERVSLSADILQKIEIGELERHTFPIEGKNCVVDVVCEDWKDENCKISRSVLEIVNRVAAKAGIGEQVRKCATIESCEEPQEYLVLSGKYPQTMRACKVSDKYQLENVKFNLNFQDNRVNLITQWSFIKIGLDIGDPEKLKEFNFNVRPFRRGYVELAIKFGGAKEP